MVLGRILLLFVAAGAPALADSPVKPLAPVPAGPIGAKVSATEFDWTRFGQSLSAPSANGSAKNKKSIHTQAGKSHSGPAGMAGSALSQVHRLAEQTAEKLWALGIPPNYDAAGRKRAQQQFQDYTLGTCGHTALCVKEVWTGAGVPEKACKTLVVIKRKADGQMLQEINADHAAMVYLHPDGPVVFDLWCHGRTQQSFANFNSSAWKGMPVGEWARRMAKEGYTHASCQEHPDLGETPPLQLGELLRKLNAR